jgi:RHS repeat-associated protein
MGRPAVDARTNKGSSAQTYKTLYSYNLDGSLATLTYPSGDVLTYAPGGAGRPLGVSDSVNQYASGGTAGHVTYSPGGALTGMLNGNVAGGFAGITTANVYNSRQQPAVLSTSAPPYGTLLSLSYNFNLGSGDNGNVIQVNNNVDSTRDAVYTYDLLNRLQQASTVNTSGTNCWGETYSVDYWANLYGIGGVSTMGGCFHESLSTTGANTYNQLAGLGMLYDAAGNVTKDNLGNTPTYDQENRIATVAGYTYSYDADGKRMEKAAGTSGTMYWPGPNGETLAETNLTGTINEEYVYFNGERIARIDRPNGTPHYYFSNNIGSHTMVTSATGACEQDIDYYPYGGVITDHCPNVPQHFKFTGKERDSESGFDMFGARYYGSSLGRFITPDWATKATTVPYADFGDPQSLNLYGYVRNNPLSKADADGHCYPWCTVIGGAIIGGVIGGGGEIIAAKLHGQSIDWKKVEGSAVKGAVTGAAIGLAGPEAGVAATAALGAGGNVVGGVADRTIQGQSAKEVLSPTEVAKDAASGAIGGAIGGAKVGEQAGEFVANNAAKVAEASGDQASAAMFTNNASAIGTGVAKAIDVTQGAAESYHDQSNQQQQQQQQQQKPQCSDRTSCH